VSVGVGIFHVCILNISRRESKIVICPTK